MILHTLYTRECSSNERLRPKGEGDTLIFSYIRRLGPFLRLKSLNFNILFVRYNSGIGGQSRNSHNEQVQFRNCTDSHFALKIYIMYGEHFAS